MARCFSGPKRKLCQFPGRGISLPLENRPMPWRLLSVLLSLAASGPVLGQGTFPFQLRVRQQSNVFAVPNSSALNLLSPAIGSRTTVNVTVIYQGSTSVRFPSAPQLLGSTNFTFTGIPETPFTLQPSDLFTFDITYTPTDSARALAQLEVAYLEASPIGSMPDTRGSILFNLTGSAPEFSLNYALQADANVIPLAPGGRLQFQPTLVNATAQANVIILNRGSGSGTVDSVRLSGEAFQLLALPLLPSTVVSGANLQFGIRYSPRRIGTDAGTLEVTLGGETITVSLDASSTGSMFTYELIAENGDVVPLQPNRAISFPDTSLGSQVSFTVQVRNTGNAEGLINIISVSGASFNLTDLPFLPATIPPNDFLTFTVTFLPLQPGRLTGRMRIGNDVFDLLANGIGTRLVYLYTNGTASTTVQPAGGTVLFSPTQVGSAASLTFTVRNEGTTTATIASIGVAETGGVFRLENLPVLPVSLAPAASLSFTTFFAPAVTGLVTSQLLVDAQSFTLTGFGTDPPPLPRYGFSGVSGSEEALQQPSVRLALLERYPLALRGVLTLAVEPEAFVADPSVQFSTGGRTVPFTIPVNSTAAVFPNGATEIKLQTGTVAGTITLIPSFATQTGLDLTPKTPEVLRFVVPRRPPALIRLQVASRTTDGFVLDLTGFTTSRSMRSVEVEFTPTPAVRLGDARVTINVEPGASAWFQNASSQAFGGQFSILLPFTLRSSAADTQPLIDLLESVSLTAANELGSSNTLRVSLR
jgi:hypothetical protein